MTSAETCRGDLGGEHHMAKKSKKDKKKKDKKNKKKK